MVLCRPEVSTENWHALLKISTWLAATEDRIHTEYFLDVPRAVRVLQAATTGGVGARLARVGFGVRVIHEVIAALFATFRVQNFGRVPATLVAFQAGIAAMYKFLWLNVVCELNSQ